MFTRHSYAGRSCATPDRPSSTLAFTVRILFVATKSPFPPTDGGRLVLAQTLQALHAAGHSLCVLAPLQLPATRIESEPGTASTPRMSTGSAECDRSIGERPPGAEDTAHKIQWKETAIGSLVSVPVPARTRLAYLATAAITGESLSVERHKSIEMGRAVRSCLLRFLPDVVHAEQLQALANCSAAFERGIPVVLRMQNVESELWRQTAVTSWYRRPLMLEARRLRHAEIAALRQCAQVVTLTETDAEALRRQSAINASRVTCVPPPFPTLLERGTARAGSPALCVSGSAGWWPNQAGCQWFIERIWPKLKAALPMSMLHVFGGAEVRGHALSWHPPPVDSIEAFPVGGICIVPLHVASGLRMRILEAWARGLPVVATTAAVRGLDVRDDRELLVADDAEEFVIAVRRLTTEPGLRERLILAGRAYLDAHHRSDAAAALLTHAYERAVQGNDLSASAANA